MVDYYKEIVEFAKRQYKNDPYRLRQLTRLRDDFLFNTTSTGCPKEYELIINISYNNILITSSYGGYHFYPDRLAIENPRNMPKYIKESLDILLTMY